MPPEVACPSKLFTNQSYLSNNQKCICRLNSLDNLFLCSVVIQLCCYLKLNSIATSVLDGRSQFLRRVCSLLSFQFQSGKQEFFISQGFESGWVGTRDSDKHLVYIWIAVLSEGWLPEITELGWERNNKDLFWTLSRYRRTQE